MTSTHRGLFRIALSSQGRGAALAFATALLMVHALAETAIPILIGVTIDRAVVPVDARALALWLALLVANFVILTVSYQTAARLMVAVYARGEQALRHLTLERILRPRLSTRRMQAGEALTYVTSDTYRVAGVAWSVAQQCATLAAIIGAGIAMLVISPLAAAVVVVCTFATVALMRVVSRPLEQRGHREQQAATEASAVAGDFMSGYRVLSGMNAQAEALARYRRASDSSRKAATSAGRALASYEAVSGALAAVASTALAGIAAWLASDGQISVGELITVLGLAQFLGGSLAHAGTFPANWIHKAASAKRLAGVIDAPDLLGHPESGRAREYPRDVILAFELKGRTPGEIHVTHGEKLGIRVPDAATGLHLAEVLGFRTPVERGTITLRIDGVHRDLRDIDPLEYRRMVVALPHRAHVGSGALRGAVTGGGDESPPQPHLVSLAGLQDTVDEIGGWDSNIGEGGERLSGGQRQRVVLARALHSDADIVVLNEPTSALDAVTETSIARALASHPVTMIHLTSSEILLGACDRVIDVTSHDDERLEDGND